jgi:5,10-methylenetetrahydrofolate reductase
VEAGADFAVTQPVFDAGQLERFLGRVRARIPVIAGIWPLTSLRNAEFLANEVPGVHVPLAVIERMRLAQEQGTPAARAEGVAIAAEMVEAIKDLVQGVQVTAPAGRIRPALDDLRGLAIPKVGS